MTTTRKTTMSINDALADPNTVFGFQYGDNTRTVVSVRRTRTGRPVVTFTDGAVCRYTGTETVVVVREVSDSHLGKPTHTGPFRHRRNGRGHA